MRTFDTLSEQEVLALAISLEEEDERIYADCAEGLREGYPSTAKVFAPQVGLGGALVFLTGVLIGNS